MVNELGIYSELEKIILFTKHFSPHALVAVYRGNVPRNKVENPNTRSQRSRLLSWISGLRTPLSAQPLSADLALSVTHVLTPENSSNEVKNRKLRPITGVPGALFIMCGGNFLFILNFLWPIYVFSTNTNALTYLLLLGSCGRYPHRGHKLQDFKEADK